MRVFKKFVVAIFIVLMINIFFILNFSEATSLFSATGYAADYVFEVFASVLGSVVSLLTWPLRLIALFAGFLMKVFTTVIAFCEGATEGATSSGTITPFDIFFNNIKLLDINFFEIGTEANFINSMRSSVAGWYYVMRMLASAILLIILIYVGIRMAISTASDKAMYKKMLVDWVSSLALIFVIQYLVIFTISCNNAIVNTFKGMIGPTSIDIESTYKDIFNVAIRITDLNSMAATVIYCMLVWQTLGLVFSYFNRMLKIAFLIIISPLITLTYSIDKMGDQKAQALNAWLKEFVFTVLIQPFHCVIYASLIGVAFDLLSKGGTDATQKLANSIIAILMIKFVKEGEKIVRKIFAFKDDNSQTSIAAGMAASAVALNQAKNIGKKTRSAVNTAKNFGRTAADLGKNAKVEALAIAAMISNKDGENKTFKERKEDIRTDINNKKADKIASKSSSRQSYFNERAVYRVAKKGSIQEKADAIRKLDPTISKEQAYRQAEKMQFAEEVKKEKEEIMAASNGTISEKEAESMARLKVAKDNTMKGKAIKRVRGRLDKINKTLGKSQVLRELGDLGKVSALASVGLMVGSGVYGTSGNLVSAIGAGAATYKGTQEFFASSGKTISNGITDNLNKMGITSAEDARVTLTDVSQNSEKYEYSQVRAKGTKTAEEFEKALKSLDDLKSKLGHPDQFQTFETNVSSIIESSPLNATEAIDDEFEKLKGKINFESMSQEDQEKLEKAKLPLTDFSNKVSIQYQLKQAESSGMDTNTIINNIVSDFASGSDGKYQEIMGISSQVSGAKTVEELEDADANLSAKLDKMSDKQIHKLIDKYEKLIGKSSAEDEARLKREQALIIGKAVTTAGRRLDEANEDFYTEYQDKLNDAIAKLQKDINKQPIVIQDKRKAQAEKEKELADYESDAKNPLNNKGKHKELKDELEKAKKARMQSKIDLQIQKAQKAELERLRDFMSELYGD